MTAPTQDARRVALQRRDELLAFVGKYGQEMEKLAPRGTTADYLVATLRQYFQQYPKLLECTALSIAQGILRVAQTGLTLGVSCDLLPFGKTCQYSPRYTGIVELALASGTRAINLGVVRDGDHFEYEKGTKIHLSHRVAAKSGAPITYGYAIAEVKLGSFSLEVMTAEMVDAHRQKYSKSWWLDERKKVIPLEEIPFYAKKTPMRQLSNVLPKNPRLAAALIFEKQVEEEIPDGEFEVVSPTDEGAPVREAVAAGGPREEPQFQDDTDLLD